MSLDVASVLLQWSVGGLLFLWVTTRRRVVGLGYGWLMRGVYSAMALGALAAGILDGDSGAASTVRDASAAAVAVAALGALAVSVTRRAAGVRGQEATRRHRRARVQAMTGAPSDAQTASVDRPTAPEFPPTLDLVAPAVGMLGVLAAAEVVGGPFALSAFRLLTGALLMGAVSDAMLLGHWYLVQPGLSRAPLKELVGWCAAVWPLSIVAWCLPDGAIQILTGSVDDGWGGLLGWTWVACALTTIGLVGATWFALRERAYSAVMAATGLLYLAILTAFGMDLVPRAVLAS